MCGAPLLYSQVPTTAQCGGTMHNRNIVRAKGAPSWVPLA